MIPWRISTSTDDEVRPIADRHYSRQKIGARRFVPPGRCLVLKTECLRAYWVTSWPFAQYVKHEWAGAWLCSAFRNEGAGLSSDLIRAAIACTLHKYEESPYLGMVTFVDTQKTRHKRDPGRCFIRAGFEFVGYTKGGLAVLQMTPEKMPPSEPWQL